MRQPWQQPTATLSEVLSVAALLAVPWGLWLFLVLIVNLPTP